MLKILTVLTLLSSLMRSQDIYLFSNALTDSSEVRALVTIDDVPFLFINKRNGVDYIAGKIECQGYEFKLITNSNGKYLSGISYANGNGGAFFVIEGKVVPFFNNIKNMSYEGVATTGIGPWRERFACKINDIRSVPFTAKSVTDLVNNSLDLIRKSIISNIDTNHD